MPLSWDGRQASILDQMILALAAAAAVPFEVAHSALAVVSASMLRERRPLFHCQQIVSDRWARCSSLDFQHTALDIDFQHTALDRQAHRSSYPDRQA